MTPKTPSKRHALRIAVMQALFQIDAQGDDFLSEVEVFFAGREIKDNDLRFAKTLVQGVVEHRKEIDRLITEVSRHWEFGRITPVDRAILRLAICELLHVEQTPPKVAINEAIELAKTFGAAESPQFINGLLDAIWKKHNTRI